MANTINYQPPFVNEIPTTASPTWAYFPAASHVNAWDIVTLSAGQIATSGNNPANGLAGIATADSNAVLAQNDTDIQGVFGVTQYGNLMPASPGYVGIIPFGIGSGVIVEMNLAATTGWVSGGTTQANFGTGVGIAKDATTGFFYADPGLGNIVAHVVGKAYGVNKGVNGDLAARVFVAFDVAAALAISVGH